MLNFLELRKVVIAEHACQSVAERTVAPVDLLRAEFDQRIAIIKNQSVKLPCEVLHGSQYGQDE